MRLGTYDLMRRGERELAAGDPSAHRTLELARRTLLGERDVEGLKHLLAVAAQLDDGAEITYATQQNIKLLTRQAHLDGRTASLASPRSPSAPGRTSPPNPTSGPTSPPKLRRPKDFWFGDPRRPRSLAIGLAVSLIMFPVAWFGLLILWALGGSATDQEIQHANRVIIVIAASAWAVGMVAVSLAWLIARRGYPPEARGALSGREGALSAVAILLVLVVAFIIGALLWNI